MTDKKLSQLPVGTAITNADLFYSAQSLGGGSYTQVQQPWSAILAALPTGSGNVSAGATLTDKAVVVGRGTTNVATLGNMTNGQLLIGSTGLDPALASLTAGTAITITPGAGSISIAVTASTFQPLDSDLTSWALITRAAGFDTFASTPNSANLATLVTDETGTAGALVFSVSPALTGNPTATTQTAGDNSTRIATTAFVATSFAPLASPTFTGDPKAPTPTAGDNDTSIATTAFVQSTLTAYADPQRAISGAAGTISTLATDVVITINWTSGTSGSYTLPVANTRAGLPIMIKDIAGTFGTRPLTINRGSTDTIDGQTSIVLNTNFQYIKLRPLAAGGAWFIER